MKKRLSSAILIEIEQNRRFYILVTAVLFIGIIPGALSAVRGTEELSEYFGHFLSAYSLRGVGSSEVFKISLFNHLRFAFIIWVSGRFTWCLPLGALQIGLKGFGVGYTVGGLVYCYKWRGLLLSVVSILPQCLILIPTAVFFYVCRIRFCADRRLMYVGNTAIAVKRRIYVHNFAVIAVFLLVILLCAFADAYAVPFLVSVICGLFF